MGVRPNEIEWKRQIDKLIKDSPAGYVELAELSKANTLAAGDKPADESAPLNPIALVAWRPAVEAMVLESAKQGVRAIVIRPAIVFGRGGGIPAELVKSARETGAARYVGDGQNRWPAVRGHRRRPRESSALQLLSSGQVLHFRSVDHNRRSDRHAVCGGVCLAGGDRSARAESDPSGEGVPRDKVPLQPERRSSAQKNRTADRRAP
jgi:hypothetical protein